MKFSGAERRQERTPGSITGGRGRQKQRHMNDKDLRRAKALARLLDSAIGIPGTPIRVGVDAILGIIPGAGDIAGAVLSSYIILAAARRGAPAEVLWRMVANVTIDTAFGAIPLVGDLFDVAYKSNVRNVEILERFAESPRKVTRRSRLLGVAILVAAVLVVIGLATLGVLLARAIWQLLTA